MDLSYQEITPNYSLLKKVLLGVVLERKTWGNKGSKVGQQKIVVTVRGESRDVNLLISR